MSMIIQCNNPVFYEHLKSHICTMIELDMGLFSLTCQEAVLFRLFTSIFTSIITSPVTVIGPRQFFRGAFPLLSC